MNRERGTTAHIHTQRIQHNLAVFKNLHPGPIMAVVKANAYGHGMAHVIPALAACDAFAVATIEEGMTLRSLDGNKRIVLLEGVFNADELQVAVDQRLDLVVHQDYQIEMLKELTPSASIDVWLKVDTGMNRLGFSVEHVAEKINAIKDLSVVNQIRVMTHFATANDPECAQTQAQLAANQWVKSLGFEYSFSNSAAVLGQLSDANEWARVGLGLYGMSPLVEQWAAEFNLQPAMHLTANVIATKNIQAGELVGYGGRFKASNNMRVGIIGLGYGDGYPWSNHSSQVLFKGQLVPVVGRISMDMMAIDLSDFGGDLTGEKVTIWGDGLPAEQVAKDLGLIPYTLTCGITNRVKIDIIQ